MNERARMADGPREDGPAGNLRVAGQGGGRAVLRATLVVTALGAVLAATACGGEEPVQLPRPMSDNPPIDYPVDLWDAGVEGETLLTVHIDVEGRVDSVRVERTSGSPELDSAAVRGGRQMRFTPGRRGDRRVGAWVRIPIRFRHDSLQTASSGTTPVDGDAPHE